MNSSRAITTCFSALLLLAAGAWFFLTNAPKIKLESPKDTTEHRFTTLQVQQFDKTGGLAYALSAPSTYHLPNEDTHHLNTPHIVVTKPNQPTWTIQSKKALVTSKAEEIQFLDQVEAHHTAYQKQAAGVFQTEAISYFPKKKLLKTPHKFTWDQASNHIESIGMQANLITQRIELLDAIKGTYTQNVNTAHLNESRVTTKMNKHNKLTRATAFGSDDKKAHFWTSGTDTKPPFHAYADTLFYHPLKNQLELRGHGNLVQGNNTLEAPHIFYDTKAKHLLTTAENEQSTVILIDPKAHPEKHL